MSHNENLSQVIELLNETKNIVESKITSIDKDLALEKLRKAYDCLLNIKINSIEIKETTLSKVIENKEPISIKTDFSETTNNELINEQHIIINEIKVKEEIIITEEKKIIEVEPTLFEINNEQNNQGSKTLSDQYRKNNTKTLSDSLQTKDNNLSSSRLLKPIKNIKSAISLNDRIMFSRDLFNNNNDLYNNTIDSINEMSSFDEAEILINNTIKNKDSETFNSFIELISRRFI